MGRLLRYLRKTLWLCAGLCLVPFCANAQIFKCVDPKTGAKTYSDVPCAPLDRAATILTPRYTTPSTTRQPQLSASQAEQGRSEPLERQARLANLTDLADATEASRDKANSIECEQAKRKLAVRKSRVTRFSSDAKEPAIDLHAACGMPKPANVASTSVGGATVVELPVQLVNCDPAGCWDTRGRRYPRAGDLLIRPQGGVCTQAGKQWVCP